MGPEFENWSAVEGAYYMGAGTSWEMIWLLLSIGLCIISLIMGARHELESYSKAERNK